MFENRKQPFISVIMPSLNVHSYIEECIESVISQTLKSIEIICVDAGSTDGTSEIIRQYAKKDTRIKYVYSEIKSYGHQMNMGMDMANGKYIAIVETDDYIPPNMMKELYEIAELNTLDFVKGDFYRFRHDNKGAIIKDYNQLCTNMSYYNRIINPSNELEVFKFIMNTWSGIYLRDFLIKHNIRHNETPGASFQDTGFWFQTFCYANRIQFINKPYYMNRRDNPGSSVYNKSKIYCPCDEYDFIYHILDQNLEIKKAVMPAYQFMRYKGYMASLNRSSIEYKREFLYRFKRDFELSKEKGELDLSLFTKGGNKTLLSIMNDPDLFFQENYGQEYANYKLNLDVTSKPRSFLRRGIGYYQENGLSRTFRKFIEKTRGIP